MTCRTEKKYFAFCRRLRRRISYDMFEEKQQVRAHAEGKKMSGSKGLRSHENRFKLSESVKLDVENAKTIFREI